VTHTVDKRRAVITGLGVLGPTGIGHERLWDAVCRRRSAIRALDRFDTNGLSSRIGGQVSDADFVGLLEPRVLRTATRAAQLAVVASGLALADAKLAREAGDSAMMAVTIGTALGGWADAEQQAAILLERGARRVNPFIVAGAGNHGPGIEVATAARAQGPQVTLSSGCPSSIQAIAHGASLIETGIADVVLAGGAEAPLSPLGFAALCRTHELSTDNDDPERAARPFDARHAGMVLSEGSAFLVLEGEARARSRGATIHACVSGAAFSCDARGLYAADESGAAGAAALRRLLHNNDLTPDSIDYVCAHANASPLFDRKEITVLTAALGAALPAIPISSIKGVIGHPFGAAGAFQAVTATLAIRDGRIPPTANLHTAAAECRAFHVVDAPIDWPVRTALVTSYGYGGVNGYLLLSAA
jgi:3-oxoacyl-[acyl-carrier-protein] synthase II